MTALVQQGERISIKVRFLQADGITTLAVSGVTFQCRRGDGTLLPAPPTPASVTEAGVEKWRVEVTPDRPGIWQFEFRATTPSSVEGGAFVVEPALA